ncbi:sperm-associated antigen 8 isoform X1 [Rhineura floridana]|uniref:sperm-associated antigen 8 isoform X1 n=1 Tax=Rhineura floridana TaxID=261503 RepID=UPI002AC7FD80|nr:sperm-associated antigen 8 isoform X1 [Rhineura floridana]
MATAQAWERPLVGGMEPEGRSAPVLQGPPPSHLDEAAPGHVEKPVGEAEVAEAEAPAGMAEPPLPPEEGVVYCPGEMLPAGPEAAPVVVRTPAYAVELPLCHGIPGPTLGELPPTEQEAIPIAPLEPMRELPDRGKCLIYNWQEERATNNLDHVPRPEGGTEGFFYRHGHQGLLTLQFLAGLPKSTTMQDSYRRPRRRGLPVRGQREAMMEWLLYQKHSKEILEDQAYPPPGPMESLSTMHHDYRQEGFLSVAPAPTKPHDYRLEQPQTFWLEHAQQVPGVSNIRTGDTPFKKCGTFTTPIMEYLDQPLPHGPENYPKL